MSIRIVKQGIQDTAQDAGRYGWQHLGINPGGAADTIAFAIANMLVGNNVDEAAVELQYPASSISFEKDALIALTGADFTATINGLAVPLNTPVAVSKGSILEFTKPAKGRFSYLAVSGGFQLQQWLGSYSTNIAAAAGGYDGRKLFTGDAIFFKKEHSLLAVLKQKSFLPLGWKTAFPRLLPAKTPIRICRGREYGELTECSRDFLINTSFTVTQQANRMGCRLSGIPLQTINSSNIVSSAVTKGTIQLLPTGQLLVLMADHQTTGGYPRVAQIVSADIHLVAQMLPGEHFCFNIIDIAEAENILLRQHQYLLQLQIACNLRLQEYLSAHGVH